MRIGRHRHPGAPTGSDVTIVDLPERHEQSYFHCLEGWSPDIVEAGDHKAGWYRQHRDDGLRVKLAVDAEDRPLGMIQYVPIEMSPAEGDPRLSMILCIWVHGHEQGVGRMQGAGIGTKLLVAAEDDVRARGAGGLAAWGLTVPVWMKASWFKRHGYLTADRLAGRELVWKAFDDSVRPPRWIRPQALPVSDGVVAFHHGWCPAANLTYERVRRAAEELGVDVRSIDTTDRATQLRFGRTDEVLVGGRPVQRGAPPSYRTVLRRVRRRGRHPTRPGERVTFLRTTLRRWSTRST